MLETASGEANLAMLSSYEAKNSLALEQLSAGGTRLEAYSPAILRAAQEASDQLLSDFAAGNAEFRDLHSRWLAFRRRIIDWNRVNELSFTSFVYRPSQNR
jgi:TRAP-type mannitol/chloroaromatic compound transport system substrate-binding protein